jgi:hypothetical protein
VVLEIKRKMGSRIKKYRASLYFSDLGDMLRNAKLEDVIITTQREEAIDDTRRFFFHLPKKQYRPSNLVVYEREAYQGKMEQGIRITFDKEIRSRLSPLLAETRALLMGQGENKGAALTPLTFNPDLTIVLFHKLFTQTKT